MDLLIGLSHAALHPMVVAKQGDLRLSSIQFGTGWLLDRHHKLLGAQGGVVTTCARVSHIKNATILGSIEEIASEDEAIHKNVDGGSLDLGTRHNNNNGGRFL